MSTSEFQGLVPLHAPRLRDGDDRMAADARVLANNLLHLADSVGQHRVNFVGNPTGVGPAQYLEPESVPAIGTYRKIAVFGPFPLTLRETGAPYQLRVRVGGASSSGDAVLLRVVVAPVDDADGERDRAADWIWESDNITSTTPAWVSGDTVGDAANARVMTVPASVAQRWEVEEDTVDDLGGGEAKVRLTLVAATVYGRTTNLASTPRLYGLHISEYVGD